MDNDSKEEHAKFINTLKKYRLKIRKKILDKRREESNVALKHLEEIVGQIYERNKNSPIGKMIKSEKNPHLLALVSAPSGSSPHSPPPPPSAVPTYPTTSTSPSNSSDSEMINEQVEYHEFSVKYKDDNMPLQQDEATHSEYPKEIDGKVILGPNGTKCDMQCYSRIMWTSAAAATRQLLLFVFGNDILATHTLSGKPSPAFYGRERPPKLQLDPVKTNDIIHCIRSKCKCSIREIRAAITTKCADTSKKYKRHQQKQLKSSNIQ